MKKLEIRDVAIDYDELHDLKCTGAIMDWVSTRCAQSVDIWKRIQNAKNVIDCFTDMDAGARYIVKSRIDLLPKAIRVSNIETRSAEQAVNQARMDYYDLFQQATGRAYNG